MATNTSRLGLLKKDTATDGNDTFNIKTMLNDNWDKIDAKVATLGADGKVPAEQLSISVSDASTTQKGVVMLEDSVTSTSVTKAATPKSVKTVNDALDAHKTDYVSHGVYGTASGTNTLTMAITLEPNVTSYPTGMLVAFKNTTANTGAVTLNINSLGAKPIKKSNGSDLSSGNLKAGGVYQARFDGSNFILLGEGGEYGTASPEQVLKGFTIGTESGVLNGAFSNLKSYQSGSVTFTTSDVQKTIAINNIDVTKSIIKITLTGFSGLWPATVFFAGKIIDSTNIQIKRLDSNVAKSVIWEVFEFSDVKSLQTGIFTRSSSGDGASSVSIGAVDVSKSMLFMSATTNNKNTANDYTLLSGYIDTSTSLKIYFPAGSGDVYWQAIEFN